MITSKFIYQEGSCKPKQYNIYKTGRKSPLATYIKGGDLASTVHAFELEEEYQAEKNRLAAIESNRKYKQGIRTLRIKTLEFE